MPSAVYTALESALRAYHVQRLFQVSEQATIDMLAKHNASRSTMSGFLRRRFSVDERTIDTAPVYVVRSRQVQPQRRCLFIHGGGGMMRANIMHFSFVARLIMQTHAEVWMPFYPLAPGPNFTDSLACCYESWQQMMEQDPLPTYIAGDSAGANLGFALTRQLLNEGKEAPRCIVGISPATGFEAPDYQTTFAQQCAATRDPLFCVEMIEAIVEHWCRGLDLDDSLLNPAYIDYMGFPPVLLLFSTAEIFYPATEHIVDAMQRAGVLLTLNRQADLMHDWALSNLFPEGAAAQCQIKRFILERC